MDFDWKFGAIIVLIVLAAAFVGFKMFFGVVGWAPRGVFYCSDVDINNPGVNPTCARIGQNGQNTFYEAETPSGEWTGLLTVWPKDVVGCSAQKIEVTIKHPDYYREDCDINRVPRCYYYNESIPDYTVSGGLYVPSVWSRLVGENQMFAVKQVFNNYAEGYYEVSVKYFDCDNQVLQIESYSHYFPEFKTPIPEPEPLPSDDSEQNQLVENPLGLIIAGGIIFLLLLFLFWRLK